MKAEDLLVMAVECRLITLPQMMDLDLQEALVKLAAKIVEASDAQRAVENQAEQPKAKKSGRTYVEPTTRRTDRGETETAHPAYAQISTSRQSGLANLYGSDFTHHNYVVLRIRASRRVRSLSTDWHMTSSSEMVEVAMSEAQWATMVARTNVGEGTCCTLRRLNGESIPEIPPSQQRSDDFRDEVKQAAAQAQEAIKAIADELNAGPPGKRRAAELARGLVNASESLVGSTAFVAQVFEEFLHDSTEAAKVEVGAFLASAIHSTGLQHLAAGAAPLVQLPSVTTTTTDGAAGEQGESR